MTSKVFSTRKGRHPWPQRTICEVHRQMYDRLCLGVAKKDWALIEAMLPLLEEVYVMGIKMTRKLTEYKLDLPEWQTNDDPEVARLRKLRVELTETLDAIGTGS